MAVGLAAAVIVVPLARASRGAPAPLGVQSASLEQSGRDVVWSVQMSVPFSPGALRAAGRSLCLLIEGVRDDQAIGQLCLIGPRPGGRTPSLQYRPLGGTGGSGVAASSVIAATVTRDGSRQLTATFLPSAMGNAYTPVRWQVESTLARPHCTSSTGTACVMLWPANGAIAPLHTPRPVGCADTGPDFVTGITTAEREIALTFDDGPWYQTPRFLTLLERYRVPATFFETGEHIGEYGEGGAIERRMLADGDMIGDHTWSHIVVAAGGPVAAEQIDRTAVAIRDATHGFTPCLFRAPEGNVSSALIGEARSMGFTTIQWDIDPRDWALPGVAEIEGNVLANAHPGAIVIMHDGGSDRSQTLDALPDIITTLRARGYTFVTVTQLLGQRVIYR
ncbi:MAG: polysaccharide deacetylase family protein [Solirubrobacteraceae bacterium]